MQYHMTASVGSKVSRSIKFDTLPVLPGVGDRVTVCADNAEGIVKLRSFIYYEEGMCHISLNCDPVTQED